MQISLTTILLIAALLGMTAGSAFASGGNQNTIDLDNAAQITNVNNINNINDNTNSNSNASTSQSSSSGDAQSASDAGNAATGGDAAGVGGAANTNTTVRVSGDANAASSAAGVYLTTSNDTCMGSSGAGGQGATFGFSIGSTWTDENCVMVKNAREMKRQGYDKAAKIRLCMDADNAIAYEAAGDPCPRALQTARTAAAMMKDARSPAADTATGGDSAAAPAGAIPPAAFAAFMLDSGNKVFFDFDKSDLKPKAWDTLDKQADWLKEHEQVRVLIEGHCDERGTREYNLALGERRAEAVKQYLIAKGVAADRIRTVSYGKDRPAIAESNEAAWSQNRRAVTQILPPEKAPEKVSQQTPARFATQHASLGHSDRAPSGNGYFHSGMADIVNGAE